MKILYITKFFPPEYGGIETLSKNLIGKEYNSQGVSLACSETALELPMIIDYVRDFSDWLSAKIS